MVIVLGSNENIVIQSKFTVDFLTPGLIFSRFSLGYSATTSSPSWTVSAARAAVTAAADAAASASTLGDSTCGSSSGSLTGSAAKRSTTAERRSATRTALCASSRRLDFYAPVSFDEPFERFNVYIRCPFRPRTICRGRGRRPGDGPPLSAGAGHHRGAQGHEPAQEEDRRRQQQGRLHPEPPEARQDQEPLRGGGSGKGRRRRGTGHFEKVRARIAITFRCRF